ncbi:hypothetical protein BDN70DRAFT_902412, partial [Pholiota conissans]
DVRDKGVSKNYNTKPNESAHRPLKRFYKRTNFKNTDPQILKLNEISVAATLIREVIAESDDAILERDLDLEKGEGVEDESKSGSLQHTTVGSPLKSRQLSEVEAEHSDDGAFSEFRKKVNTALISFISSDESVANEEKATPYQYIKLSYESVINWQITTDILRTNECFHNRPRYDFVLLQASKKDFIFAQLLYTFGVTFNECIYQMALILPMDKPIVQSKNLFHKLDIDLRFKRLRSRPRSGTAVIGLDSLIRGAVLIEAYGCKNNDEFIVMDVVDADMWWRMKTIKLARSQVLL